MGAQPGNFLHTFLKATLIFKRSIEIRFEKPFAGIARTSIKTESLTENKTKVIWGMEGKSKYPMNLMNPFMDNLLGKDLQISLVNLKTILEK